MVGAPGEEPSLHIFVFDVVSRFHLVGGLPGISEQSFLVGNIGFDSIGDEEI
jgi:hypothetical protein